MSACWLLEISCHGSNKPSFNQYARFFLVVVYEILILIILMICLSVECHFLEKNVSDLRFQCFNISIKNAFSVSKDRYSLVSKCVFTLGVQTKSDSDVIVCLQLLRKTFLYTPLELT